MIKKTIFILAFSAIAIVIAIISINNDKSSTISNDFILYDTASVEQIFMVNKQEQHVSLEKRNNIWYVNGDNIAIGENVDILLRTLMYIEVKTPVSKSARNSYISKMATNSTKVEIYGNEPLFKIFGIDFFKSKRKILVFYVGPPTRNHKGTIMKMEDSDELYVTYLPGFNGYLSERFSANFADWLNHNIFKLPIKSIVSVKVEFGENPNQSYIINSIGNRNYNLTALSSNKKVHNYDTVRVLQELAFFRNVNFETLLDNIPQQRYDSLQSNAPYITLSVTNIAQQVTKVRMYRRNNFTNKPDFNGEVISYDVDRMYALVDGFDYVVTVQYFVFDNITRPLDYLLGKDIYGESSLEVLR
ncbi:MAG: hypothetical protein KAG84_02555 [Bacteroidales bacterium]|nr:hypothetical protein [Bacteroidales bacterium]